MAAGPDIFTQIGQLFRNQTPDGDVHVYVLHRFFASDPAFASAAKELSPIRDDKMVVEIWRTSLPRMAKAPYFKYAGPKRPAAPLALVKKFADSEGYTIREAEEYILMLEKMGKGSELLAYYGIEKEKEKPAK